ncbi:MAG: Rpn family recombination-promoting nuclease/putative transposase [Polyangiaceae bacterium]|nr:Rpn family recombination-promoting nuclease/putative transposase [Polyangiaceae bacterium]
MEKAKAKTKVARHPHDRLVRRVFSNPQHAKGELQHLLPKELSAKINWSTLKLEPGAFVDDALKASYSDLLFSVEMEGSKTYIYLLFEHQAKPQRFLPFRQLKYLVRLWDKWLQEHPNATHLPIVIPMVLCHGQTPWTYPLQLKQLVNIPAELDPLVSDFVPTFRVLADDLATVSDDELRTRAMSEFSKITLWCLKTATSTQELLRTADLWQAHFHALLQSRNGIAAMSIVFRYMLSVHEASQTEVLPRLAKILKMEDKNIMPSIAEHLIAKGKKFGIEKGRKEGIKLGREEGVKQGREEGVEQGHRTLLLRQLQLKFGTVDAPRLARIERASRTDLETWAERILTANTLSEVFDG